MPTITKEVIGFLEEMLSNSSEVKAINEQLQNAEPELVKWCQEEAQNDVTRFLKGGVFANPEIMHELGNRFVVARLSAYLLAQVGHTQTLYGELALKVEDDGSVSEDIDDEYEQWIGGRLPERFYNYDITAEMRKSSDEQTKALVKARENYLAFKEAEEEKAAKKAESEKKRSTMAAAKKEAGIVEEKGSGSVVKRTRRPKKRSGNDLTIDDPGKS